MRDRKSPSAALREYFLLGLVAISPLVVTYWVLSSVVLMLDDLMYRLIPGLSRLPELIGFGMPGFGIVATLIVLIAAGVLAKTVAGKMFGNLSDSLLGRLPVVRGLYGVAKQISSIFFSTSPTSAFKHVVYVPFPHAGAKALAFVASSPDEKHILVFVPTAPNPTGGYVLRFEKSQIEETDLSVDAALQIIISCGALSPGKSHEPSQNV